MHEILWVTRFDGKAQMEISKSIFTNGLVDKVRDWYSSEMKCASLSLGTSTYTILHLLYSHKY
jgi:hypothetical protein